jgi:hypothetical protein
MLLIAIAANWFMKSTDTPDGEWRPAAKLSTEETALLEAHAAKCQSLFDLVLANQTPESLSPFVLNKLDTLADMARFYRLNPPLPPQASSVVKTDVSVIRLPEGPAIEGRWELEDGRLFDVIFRRENDEWLVDWHHFARYSSHPWPLFLAGDGPDVGEFRLLVRRRLGLDVFKEKEDPESPLEFVFHLPQFGRPDKPGPASPVFVLERESIQARRLMLGFEQYRSGDRPFRALLPSVEPDDEMMRVRVVVRRIDDTGGRRFELEEIKAVHWLQHDDPGLSFGKNEAKEP